MNGIRQDAIYKVLARNMDEVVEVPFAEHEGTENQIIYVCTFPDPKVSHTRGRYLSGYFCLNIWMRDFVRIYNELKVGYVLLCCLPSNVSGKG